QCVVHRGNARSLYHTSDEPIETVVHLSKKNERSAPPNLSHHRKNFDVTIVFQLERRQVFLISQMSEADFSIRGHRDQDVARVEELVHRQTARGPGALSPHRLLRNFMQPIRLLLASTFLVKAKREAPCHFFKNVLGTGDATSLFVDIVEA